MRLDGIIFDLDGTLSDTLPACFAAFRRALDSCGHPPMTDVELMEYFGPSEEGIFQRLAPDNWRAYHKAYLDVYEEEQVKSARLFPGIEDILRTLKARGVRMAIVTGKGRESAAVSIRLFRLERYLDGWEPGAPSGNIKPAAIARVLARWKMSPERVAYLGDTPEDAQAARTAGLVPLSAAWDGRADPARLHAASPAVIFPSVEDFHRWVERLEPASRLSERADR
jgi:phosphoglycolate phosphatase-like HAD superfamily hydrolase